MSSSLTASIDVAQVVLYLFWAFFFGLIFWLRREDRREGYPLETDAAGLLAAVNPVFIPPAKTFLLPHGGSVEAPRFDRDTREILATRISGGSGFPLQPSGDPLLSGVGPAAYAERSHEPELTREGHPAIVPIRVAHEFAVCAGPDPRGWQVLGSDRQVAGTVKDLWIDRSDVQVRYLELELAESSERRLVPITMLRLQREPQNVEVASLKAHQFAHVPTLKNPDQISVNEEERVCAFYAGGRLYSDPKRIGPVL